MKNGKKTKATATRVAKTKTPFDAWLDAMPLNDEPVIDVRVCLDGYLGTIIAVAQEQKTTVRDVLKHLSDEAAKMVCDYLCGLHGCGEPIEGLSVKGGAK